MKFKVRSKRLAFAAEGAEITDADIPEGVDVAALVIGGHLAEIRATRKQQSESTKEDEPNG